MGRRLRSHLYVPADQERLLNGAEARGADAIILDLEDGVSHGRKDDALSATVRFLSTPPGSGERWARVNGSDRGHHEIELLAATPGLNGIWLPKAEPNAWFVHALGLLSAAGLRVGVLVESAAGLAGFAEFPELPDSVLVQFGQVDFAASMRIRDTSDESMAPYRAHLILECARRGLAPPVAPVETRIRDNAEFYASTSSLRDRGFGSRACIHPSQVSIANDVFATKHKDLERATQIIRQFDKRTEAGSGVYADKSGDMVDVATVRWARDLIAEEEGHR